MLKCKRELFSLEDNVHYLNNAYMSPNLKSVEMAGVIAVRQKSRPYQVKGSDFFEPVDQLKKSFAALINVTQHERIAIVPSASYGLSSVARNISAPSGSKIIIPAEQFPSNYYVWEKLAQQKGYTIEIVAAPDVSEGRAKLWNDRIVSAIDEHTALVACGQVHWADGSRFDLKEFRKKCDEVGSLLILDGSQSVGAMPIDVAEIRPDALICVGYKWLFGPYSIGFAYYGEVFDGGEAIEENWINRKNSQDFKGLVDYEPEYKPYAHRYCVGENSNFIGIPMMQTALQQIAAWEVGEIQAYSKLLIDPYLRAFKDMGFIIEDEEWRCNHLLGMRAPDDVDLGSLSKKLKVNDVHVSIRGNAIRVATSVYNSKRDMDKFYGILHRNLT